MMSFFSKELTVVEGLMSPAYSLILTITTSSLFLCFVNSDESFFFFFFVEYLLFMILSAPISGIFPG